jgi:asparagine synthase (glutamine-hydrolysing)
MQRVATQPVRTFSMGFGDEAADESLHARRVAAHLGTDHTEMRVSPQDVLGVVPGLSAIYDEPFADSSQVPTVLLSRLTRRHVTVALSGDAGDELFGGYNRYVTAIRLGGALEQWPGGLRRGLAHGMQSVPASLWDRLGGAARAIGIRGVPPSLGEKVARVAGFLAAPDGAAAYWSTVSQWVDPSAMPVAPGGLAAELPPCDDAALAQRMMWWDMQTYLPDDILVKVDRAAMAHSLETRVPFLDHRIVEFALATPMQWKIRDGKTKWLLRELLARHLPRAMFERPKQGFTLPLDQWLRGPLRDWAESLLSPQALQASGLLEPGRVRRTWDEHLSGHRNHQRALWTVLMLQSWLQDQTDHRRHARSPAPASVAA